MGRDAARKRHCVRLLVPKWVGWALASSSGCKPPAKAVGVQIPPGPPTAKSAGLFAHRTLMLLLEHLADFVDGGRILGLLVGGAEGHDAREPQRKSRLVADLAGGMPRAGRDLVGQDLNDHLRPQPDVRD